MQPRLQSCYCRIRTVDRQRRMSRRKPSIRHRRRRWFFLHSAPTRRKKSSEWKRTGRRCCFVTKCRTDSRWRRILLPRDDAKEEEAKEAPFDEAVEGMEEEACRKRSKYADAVVGRIMRMLTVFRRRRRRWREPLPDVKRGR